MAVLSRPILPVIKKSDVQSFTFLPHNNDTFEPNWPALVNEVAAGVWLLNRPAKIQPCSARGWSLAIPTKKNHVLLIYPRGKTTDDKSALEIICQPINNIATSTAGLDLQTMFSTSAAKIGRAVNPSTTVGNILTTLEMSGVTHYMLYKGRGLRYWICLALQQIKHLIKEPRTFDFLPDIAFHKLRRCTVMVDTHSAAGKMEQINDIAICKGAGIPHLWTSEAFATIHVMQIQLDAMANKYNKFGTV